MHIDSQHVTDGLIIPASNVGSVESTAMLGHLGIPSRLSSRELDPNIATVPFKERIHSGMVVSWIQPTNSESALNVLDHSRIGVILCPFDAVQGTNNYFRKSVRNPVDGDYTNKKESCSNSGAAYLCAMVTPGLMAKSYELNLWQQIVINVGMMEQEIFLEYDPGSRYYYISVER
jgi:kinesin family protein 2/24